MTSHQKKNVLVGLTVLGAFFVMGWMIIQFGGRLGNLTAGATYVVHMVAPQANGLSEGAPVQYLGMPVGRVDSIRLNSRLDGFDVQLRIEQELNLPANVTATIRSINPISGAAAVVLEPTDVPQGSLKDVAGDRVIEAQVSSSSLVPDEVSRLAEELRLAVREFRESGMIGNINRQVEEVGRLARSMEELVGDDALRGDIRASATSIREAAASAERIGKQLEEFTTRLDSMQEQATDVLAQVRDTAQSADRTIQTTEQQVTAAGRNVDEISKELISRLEQMNQVLANIHSITRSIDQGEGTVGKLVKDDRLYEALVINMQILEQTFLTTNRLLEQWEQEGIRLRLFR